VVSVAVAVAILLLSGCTGLRDWYGNGYKVGPQYCPPMAPLADHWIDANDPHVQSVARDYANWWTLFRDPVLDRLVQTASCQNVSLQTAGFRILEARAQRDVATGNLFPQQQQANGSYQRGQISQNAYPYNLIGPAFPGFPYSYNAWSAGLNASWELDFWGKFRRGIEAADASLRAQIEDYDNVLVLLQAEVATNYVQMRTFAERLKLARQNVALQKQSLAVVEQRFHAGLVTELDLQQAKYSLANTEALLPNFETGQRQSQNRLCTLMGCPPHDMTTELGPDAAMLEAPQEVVVGIPAELLGRRPDVRRAERQAAAQSARIGIAEADFYPQIAITGSISYQAENLNELFTPGSVAGVVGPGFQWNILNYGRIKNNVRVQDARFQQAVLTYRDTVLRAYEEVEDAVIAFLHEQQRARTLDESARAAARSTDLALRQYERGLIYFQPLLDSQRVLVQEQDTLSESRGLVLVNLIAVYRALAGGWTARLPQGSPTPTATAEPVAMPEELPASSKRSPAADAHPAAEAPAPPKPAGGSSPQ
jgi:NodT family efflux transporter outer membrane factor (OMF) lipoprotein